MLDRAGHGLNRGQGGLADFLIILLGLCPSIWGRGTQDMVEAGEADVKAQPKFSKELVVESVELL